ncbi:MAG: hypothetical protein AAF738_00975 [Bacteroidota bacterium]
MAKSKKNTYSEVRSVKREMTDVPLNELAKRTAETLDKNNVKRIDNSEQEGSVKKKRRKSTKPVGEVFNMRMSPVLHDLLKKKSAALGVSKSHIVSQALMNYFHGLGDLDERL